MSDDLPGDGDTGESSVPDWAEGALPQELHSAPFLKDTSNAEEFMGKLNHAAQHMGNSLRIPGPDASEETWAEFRSKVQDKVPNLHHIDLESSDGQSQVMAMLGLPETVADYGANDEHEWLAEVAHKAKLTKSQFADLVENLGEVNKSRSQETNAEMAAQLDALYLEWGLSKTKKLENIEGLLALTDAPENLKNMMKDQKMDPTTLQWLDRMAGKFSESSKFKDDRNDPDRVTPLEAQAQIQELLNNPEYFKNTPYAMELRKKMVKLQKAASPQASTDPNALLGSNGLDDIINAMGEQ